MDDYLAKPFTLEQMRAMLANWLGPSDAPAKRDQLSLVAALPGSVLPIDHEVLDSLRQLQKESRPDIVQQVIDLYFKGAADLLRDLEIGAANGDAALLHHASHALKSASANVGAIALADRCRELEAVAKSGIVADAARAVREIREDYRMVEASLSARLPRVA
jgi:HPt (histidine-containing phosphotransfer) domain-containing protein